MLLKKRLRSSLLSNYIAIGSKDLCMYSLVESEEQKKREKRKRTKTRSREKAGSFV
jgi:hypothetical protein